MATAQELRDNQQAKKAAKAKADAAVEADKAQIAADTAAAQQAATDAASADAEMVAKYPEGQAFVFGSVVVEKLHGEIVELPVTDPSTDLG